MPLKPYCRPTKKNYTRKAPSVEGCYWVILKDSRKPELAEVIIDRGGYRIELMRKNGGVPKHKIEWWSIVQIIPPPLLNVEYIVWASKQ